MPPTSESDPAKNAHRAAQVDPAVRDLLVKLISDGRASREEQGFTQTRIADAMGTSQRTVSQIETGAHVPYLDTYLAYIAALGGQITVTFPEV